MRLALVIAAILVLGLIHTASATTYINNSTPIIRPGIRVLITKPGVYVLTTNLPCCEDIGIAIYANNVTLIGNGHTVTGFNTGILVYGNNVTVKGCRVSGCGDSGWSNYVGISVKGNNNKILNCTANGNYGWKGVGIQISGNDTIIANCSADRNKNDGGMGAGIQISGNNITVKDCTASGNRGAGIGFGIQIKGNNNVIVHCTASENYKRKGAGIQISGNNITVKDCTANINNIGDFDWNLYMVGIQIKGNNNVIVHCTASGNGAGIGFGIQISGNNITVKDCTAADRCYVGIQIKGNNNVIVHCTASGNGAGIQVMGSNITVKDCTSKNDWVGIQISGNNITVKDCTANGNRGAGIVILGGNSNTIYSNHILYNHIGLQIYHSFSNLIYNNYFNNSKNVLIYGTHANKWNITPTSGKNIVGGPYIAGNYWATPDKTGFSQVTPDKNCDGICDKPYDITTNNVDYYPLSMNYDIIPPKINVTVKKSSISNPVVSITINITDNKAIANYAIYLNGKLLKSSSSTTKAVTYTVNLKAVATKTYCFKVTATDFGRNVATKNFTVSFVRNGPHVKVLYNSSTVTTPTATPTTPVHTVAISHPPVASFTYTNTNTTVTFNASKSYDPDGYIKSYFWNFGDGSYKLTTTPVIKHTYPKPGTYKVSLTVTDNSGYQTTVSKVVNVTKSKVITPTVPTSNYTVFNPMKYDTNHNGRIDLNELEVAIKDWLNNKIDMKELEEVITIWLG